MREAAEEEERVNYGGRMPPEWLSALAPLGTDAVKEHITTAPYVVVMFRHSYGVNADGSLQLPGQGRGGAGRQVDQLRAHLAVDVGVRDDEVDEATGRRHLRVEHLAGEHQPVGDVRHHPRQHHRRDHRGDDADPHLGEGEGGGSARDHDVAGGQQSHAPGPGRTTDDGNHRLR